MTNGLVIEDLSVRLGGFALRVEGLRVAPGSLCGVMGRSGSGKSTLLNALGGFLPAGGRVRAGDRAVEGLPPEKRRMAMVFQRGALFPHLSVLDNVAFPLRLQGMRAADRRGRAQTWLDRLEIGSLADRSPSDISQGQAQRVALARALIAGFPVLLMDEPFSALDVGTRARMRSLIAELVRQEGLAAVMVSHFPEDVLAMCDQVVCLSRGSVVWQGERAEFDPNHPAVRDILSE